MKIVKKFIHRVDYLLVLLALVRAIPAHHKLTIKARIFLLHYTLRNLCSNWVKWNIAKIWIVFNIFSSVPELSKKNSKACFCISVAGILIGTAKKYHKKYRNNVHCFTIPQVSKSSICRDYIPFTIPYHYCVWDDGFTWELIVLGIVLILVSVARKYLWLRPWASNSGGAVLRAQP